MQSTLAATRPIGKSGGLRRVTTLVRKTVAFGACLGLALFIAASLARPALAAPPISERDAATWRAAFRAADAEHWDEAHRLAAGAGGPGGPLLAKVLRWQELSRNSGHGSFTEISTFIQHHGSWPGLNGLRRQAELALSGDESPARMRDWFGHNPPLTAPGAIAFAEALVAAGAESKAIEMVRRFWMDTDVRADDETLLRSRLGSWLHPRDHARRLERLLWDGKTDAARRMLPLVDDDQRRVAEARLASLGNDPAADSLVRSLPESLRQDQGVLYDQVHRLRRRDDMDGALELIASAPAEPARPGPWWTERHSLARYLLEHGKAAQAYRLVRAPSRKDAPSFTEAEFFAGWIALRRLDQPDTAFEHFQLLFQAGASPITRSRGAYWSGRAAEAAGNAGSARQWYGEAARFGTTFYGQLAQNALGYPSLRLPAETTASPAASAAFERDERVQLVRLFAAILPQDSEDRAGLFIRRLIRDGTDEDGIPFALAAALAQDIHRPDLAVAAARTAAQQGHTLISLGYPLVDLRRNAGVDPALTLALIRQESSFNPAIVSSAGARGLMQLMPGTAKRAAKKAGLALSASPQALEDAGTNIHLGTTYFSEVLDTFGGATPLAIAAYNAGPSRVSEWLGRFGDPRQTNTDSVDWVESIPYSETRNYVQRVLEGAQIYRVRLSQSGRPGGSSVRLIGRDLGLK